MLDRTRRAILRTRPDRKGHGLLLLAAVWCLIGLSTAQEPHVDSAFHQLIPSTIAGAAWIGSAAMAVVAAWVKCLRPWAMAALVIMPGVRCVSYLGAWVVSMMPGGSPGYDRGWVAAIAQVVMVAFVFYIATDSKDTTVDDLTHVLRSTGGER